MEPESSWKLSIIKNIWRYTRNLRGLNSKGEINYVKKVVSLNKVEIIVRTNFKQGRFLKLSRLGNNWRWYVDYSVS